MTRLPCVGALWPGQNDAGADDERVGYVAICSGRDHVLKVGLNGHEIRDGKAVGQLDVGFASAERLAGHKRGTAARLAEMGIGDGDAVIAARGGDQPAGNGADESEHPERGGPEPPAAGILPDGDDDGRTDDQRRRDHADGQTAGRTVDSLRDPVQVRDVHVQRHRALPRRAQQPPQVAGQAGHQIECVAHAFDSPFQHGFGGGAFAHPARKVGGGFGHHVESGIQHAAQPLQRHRCLQQQRKGGRIGRHFRTARRFREQPGDQNNKRRFDEFRGLNVDAQNYEPPPSAFNLGAEERRHGNEKQTNQKHRERHPPDQMRRQERCHQQNQQRRLNYYFLLVV